MPLKSVKKTNSPSVFICSVCGKKKIRAEFYEDSRRRRGVSVTCRGCMRDNRLRSKYREMIEADGIESLHKLREKSERTLRILNEVIAAPLLKPKY